MHEVKNCLIRGGDIVITEAILTYIKTNGIKQNFICKKTGLSIQGLSKALHGKRRMSIEEYSSICKVLNVPYDFFFKNHDNEAS